ncbi:helix-turn-helix domain-containing protein [Gorillibacterium sp. sgz5001074]|uniref:helix-turn-helix domain-containing protein n=1 Tax=Gorillibacterium sp. sgz5001074 TaxID=3446695 RepID=UPI003F66DD7D
MRSRSGSYYVKLVVFCFIITSLPVVLLGILSYGHASKVVQSNANAQKRLNLAQMETNVEQLLKTVDQSATHFLSSYMVQTALGEPLNPRQFALVNQLKTELGFLQRLDSGISDITLLSRTGNWLMNNNGIYRLDQVKGMNYQALMEATAASFWTVESDREKASAPKDGTAPSANDCSQQLRLVKKLPLTAFTPTGLAVLTIPACTFSDQISLDSAKESFLILDEHRNPVWSEGLPVRHPEPLLLALTEASAEGQMELTLDGQPAALMYRVSDYTGWTYVSAAPIAQLTKQSRGIGWFTFWICLMLLMFFILLSLVLSRRMYRPIVALYREVTGGKTGSEQGRRVDELRVIGEHMHTMSRTQLELKDRLQGQMEQLKTFFMLKLVLGGLKEEEIAAGLDRFDLKTGFRRLAVVAAEIDLEPTRFESKDHDLLLFAVHNMVEELLPEGARLAPILMGRYQITVMISEHDDEVQFREELFARVKGIQDSVAGVLGLPVYAGISPTYVRLGDIPRAYEEAAAALGSRKRLGGKSVVDYDELGESRAMLYSYPAEMEKELFEAVKLAERERTEELLGRMIGEICSSSPALHDRQLHVLRLLMNLLNLARSMDVQALVPADQQALFDGLFRLDLPQEGEAWLLEKVVGPILAGASERTELRHLHLSRELVRIIQEEFETDLSIELCAERLHYNASYLSTVFRKSMDVPFSVYLAQHRHRMAQKWLVETGMSVKEISERLRYNNPQNFIRSFRKQEGVPPGKYRELNSGGTGTEPAAEADLPTERSGDHPEKGEDAYERMAVGKH